MEGQTADQSTVWKCNKTKERTKSHAIIQPLLGRLTH